MNHLSNPLVNYVILFSCLFRLIISLFEKQNKKRDSPESTSTIQVEQKNPLFVASKSTKQLRCAETGTTSPHLKSLNELRHPSSVTSFNSKAMSSH